MRNKGIQIRNKGKQRGIVAIGTAIVFSILFTIVALSTVGLMLAETRQATNYDQSIKAYYAAEAGVEDALLKIKNNITTEVNYKEDNCTKFTVGAGDVTCRTIKRTTQQVQGQLFKEQPTQLDISGYNTVAFMKVSWNLSGKDAAALSTTVANCGFPASSDWDFPSVFDISFVNYPTAASFTIDDVGIKTAVLRPNGTGCTGSTRSVSTSAINIGTELPANQAFLVNCAASSSGYNCVGWFTGFSSTQNYIIRMRPRFAGTNYRLEFYTSALAPISVPDQFVTIDVTAKTGGVFRRIINKLQVQQGVLNGLDYVLFSDTDICKDFDVDRSTLAASGGSCPF